MRDDLLKRLRCTQLGKCQNCKNSYLEQVEPNLYRERCAAIDAADAIEEMQKILDAVHDAHTEGYDVGYWAGRRDYEPKWIPVTDIEHLPNTDSGVVGYFGGGAFDQLRWYDFVWTASDGTLVSECTERDVMNEHCIAVFKLPEPPKEETC